MSGEIVNLADHPRFTAEPTQYSTVKDAANHFRVHENTVRNWIKRGMPARKFGTIRRLNLVECERWLNGQTPNG